MNYSKVFNDVMKSAEKRDTDKKDFFWKWGLYDNLIGLIPPGAYEIILVPMAYEYMNMKRVFKDQKPYDLSKIFYKHNKAEILTDTYTSKLNEKKKMCHVFKNSKGEEIWIDESLLKPFADKYTEHVYKGTNPKNLVEIWTKDEELLGGVLPMNHK